MSALGPGGNCSPRATVRWRSAFVASRATEVCCRPLPPQPGTCRTLFATGPVGLGAHASQRSAPGLRVLLLASLGPRRSGRNRGPVGPICQRQAGRAREQGTWAGRREGVREKESGRPNGALLPGGTEAAQPQGPTGTAFPKGWQTTNTRSTCAGPVQCHAKPPPTPPSPFLTPPKERWATARVHKRQSAQSAERKLARQWPIRP